MCSSGPHITKNEVAEPKNAGQQVKSEVWNSFLMRNDWKNRSLLPRKRTAKAIWGRDLQNCKYQGKKIIIICYLFQCRTRATSDNHKPQVQANIQKRRDFFAWDGDKPWNSLPLGAVSAVFTAEVVQNDEENPQRNIKRRTSLSSQEVS